LLRRILQFDRRNARLSFSTTQAVESSAFPPLFQLPQSASLQEQTRWPNHNKQLRPARRPAHRSDTWPGVSAWL